MRATTHNLIEFSQWSVIHYRIRAKVTLYQYNSYKGKKASFSRSDSNLKNNDFNDNRIQTLYMSGMENVNGFTNHIDRSKFYEMIYNKSGKNPE